MPRDPIRSSLRRIGAAHWAALLLVTLTQLALVLALAGLVLALTYPLLAGVILGGFWLTPDEWTPLVVWGWQVAAGLFTVLVVGLLWERME